MIGVADTIVTILPCENHYFYLRAEKYCIATTYIDLKVRDAVALQKTKRCRRALQFFKLTPVSNIMELLFNFLCMMIRSQ